MILSLSNPCLTPIINSSVKIFESISDSVKGQNALNADFNLKNQDT